jgi:hypothetical protein
MLEAHQGHSRIVIMLTKADGTATLVGVGVHQV